MKILNEPEKTAEDAVYTVHDDFSRFFNEKGDPDFNPKRNEAIIEETIRKHERNIQLRNKEYNEVLGERVDAVAMYLKHLAAGNKSTDAEKYFGRKNLAALQGQKIRQKLIDAHNKVYQLQEV